MASIFIKEVLPPLLLDYMRLLKQSRRLLTNKAVLRSNLKWQNVYAGKSVYVVGNGPSLTQFDRTEFSRHSIIVMNNFHRASWCKEVRPVAHCIGEPPSSPAWVDPGEIISGTDSLSYWLHLDVYRKILGPLPASKQLHYVLGGYEPRIWGRRRIDLHGISLGYQTTAIMAIEVALYMGFKEIRLVGFDHDWLASPEYSSHFYSSAPDAEDKLGTLSYLQILQYVARMWEGYYALREAAKIHDAVIFNCTTKSYLDVFDRA